MSHILAKAVCSLSNVISSMPRRLTFNISASAASFCRVDNVVATCCGAPLKSLAETDLRLGAGSGSKTRDICLSEAALGVRSPLKPSHCFKLSGSAAGLGSGERDGRVAADSELWRL